MRYHNQGRIKLFGAPRQWKHFRPLFQAVFLSRGGGYYPPDWVEHHASQSKTSLLLCLLTKENEMQIPI